VARSIKNSGRKQWAAEEVGLKTKAMKCSEVELGPGKVGKLEANRLREPVSISSAGKGSSGWAAKSITIHTAEKHTITGLQLSGFDSGTGGGLEPWSVAKSGKFSIARICVSGPRPHTSPTSTSASGTCLRTSSLAESVSINWATGRMNRVLRRRQRHPSPLPAP